MMAVFSGWSQVAVDAVEAGVSRPPPYQEKSTSSMST